MKPIDQINILDSRDRNQILNSDILKKEEFRAASALLRTTYSLNLNHL